MPEQTNVDAQATANVMRPPLATVMQQDHVAAAAYLMKHSGTTALMVMDAQTGERAQSDAEVIARLSTVLGIGIWTAQMFLIFQLRRLDVWRPADLGVRKGFGLVWGIPTPTAKQLEPLGDPFRPYRSVVTWYCWRGRRTLRRRSRQCPDPLNRRAHQARRGYRAPGHHGPIALYTGGYERGPVRITIPRDSCRQRSTS